MNYCCHELSQKLMDSHQDVRCLSLQLLSQLCPKDGMRVSGGRYIDFPDLFCEFSTDQDPRVRASSLQALVSKYQLKLSIFFICGSHHPILSFAILFAF